MMDLNKYMNKKLIQSMIYSDELYTMLDDDELKEGIVKPDFMEALSEFVQNIFTGNILEVLKLIDKYNDSGKNIIKLSEEIIILLKNILLYKTVNNYFEENDNIELYKNLGNTLETSKLINLIDSFNDSIPKLKQSNDPKLILELLIIKHISDYNKRQLETAVKEEVVVPSKLEKPIIKEETKKEEIKKEPVKENIIPQTTLEPSVAEPKIVRMPNKSKPKITNEILEKLEEVKKVRVNNTLAGFNKKLFASIKNELENIRDMLLIPEYSQIVSTILDGNLKAASTKNLIFVYDTKSLSNHFNENLLLIEDILEQNYHTHYDVIAVDNISWEIIKKEFNSKSKQYVYEPETIDIKDLLKTDEAKDELNELFGEIVEIVN